MTIDIISFTDDQYKRLTDEQLMEVRNVQQKKNKLLRKLDEDKKGVKYALLQAGTYVGSTYEKVCEELQAVCDEEIASLRDGLLFYLHYAVHSEGETTPYLVDYSLPYEERIPIVRAYYESAYPDAEDRVMAFKVDEVAMSYLGEFYGAIYELYYAEAYM